MTTGPADDGRLMRRFAVYRIIEHWVLIVLFSALLMTGLAQKFHALRISHWLLLHAGGIDALRALHHGFGVAFMFLAIEHLAVCSIGVMARRWQPSMLVTFNDFSDALSNLRYYIGLQGRPARCDRYDYKQKFIYWLVILGGLQMIATGLVLWFPVEAARFLPGESIPASKSMHSNEAMLMFALLAVWHIYDSLFSPDVFPLDTSIFLGYISRRRMEREHYLELMRLEGASEEDILDMKHREEGSVYP